MNTCKHCFFWRPHKTYGPLVSWFDHFTSAQEIPLGAQQGPSGFRPLVQTDTLGACSRFKNESPKDDEIACPPRHCAGHGDYREGFVETGEDFGCIHFRKR